MLRAGIAGIAIVVCACHHTPVYVGVRGQEISTQLEQLRRDGEAQVPTEVVSGKDRAPGDVETVFYQQTVTVDGRTTSIETLAAGCEPGTDAGGGCALATYRDTLIKLRELPQAGPKEAKHGSAAAIITGGLALGAAGTGIWCLAECTHDKGLKTLALGFGAAVLGVVSYVLAGGTIRD